VSDASPVRHPNRYGAWIPGVALIGLGLVFLIQNYLGREIHNWWALFILIPVFFTLERGYASLQAKRPAEALGKVLGALALFAVTVILFLDLRLTKLCRFFPIIAGPSLLLSRP